MQTRTARVKSEMQELLGRLQSREPTPKEFRRCADLKSEFEHLQVTLAGMVMRHDLLAAELTSLGAPAEYFSTFAERKTHE
jgi:hypothetical protein